MRLLNGGALGGGFAAVTIIAIALANANGCGSGQSNRSGNIEESTDRPLVTDFLGNATVNALQLVEQGRRIFRFDTFGDEAFWSGQLQIQKAVASLPPATALA